MTQDELNEKKFIFENGTTYFSKKTERKILFVMTFAMLVWGIVEGLTDFLN
ncbi:hypothetical protein [Maridesulfovibrio sp.]|uniref:hypothetical protein n=1 Tax=Maridesulfovibrio sp. TaxID=2795000 RepID=UPI002A188C94|nr:hypothetical protein [Maridesulfovibrio sp.]